MKRLFERKRSANAHCREKGPDGCFNAAPQSTARISVVVDIKDRRGIPNAGASSFATLLALSANAPPLPLGLVLGPVPVSVSVTAQGPNPNPPLSPLNSVVALSPVPAVYGPGDAVVTLSAAITAARSPLLNANPATAAAPKTQILRICNIFSSPPDNRNAKPSIFKLLSRPMCRLQPSRPRSISHMHN